MDTVKQRRSRGRAAARPRGATLVWVAIVIFVLVGFVALAVDWGYAYYTTQKLQNAADAAALAGAQRVWFSHAEARERAMEFSSANEAGGNAVLLDENGGNVATGDIVTGVYDEATRIFTPTDEEGVANAVMVNARRTTGSPNGALGLVWGGIFGIGQTQFSRWAIAVNTSGPAGNAIIALDPDDPQSFYMHGTPMLDVGRGNVQVNSSHSQASRMSGTSDLVGRNVNIVGEPGARFDGYVPPPTLHFNEGRPFVPDPLADLPEPDHTAAPKFNKIDKSGTYSPGYYPGGFSDKPNTSIFLNPGVYIFDNGFSLKGNLTGYEVMIFVRTGAVDHTSNNVTTLTPPDDGTYQGVQFFQSRSNATPAKLVGGGTVTGQSNENGAGTMYFPAARFEMGGNNSHFYISSIIAKNVEVRGTGDIYVTGSHDSSSGGQDVYLAE